MFNAYLLIDSLVVVALLGLGLTVLLQNKKSELNRIFAFFVSFIGIWIIANYISNDIDYSPKVALIANYFVFFFSFSAAFYLLRFSATLAEDTVAIGHIKSTAPSVLVIGLLAFTPIVVNGTVRQGNVYAVKFGALAPLYFTVLVGILTAIMVLIYRDRRRSRGDKRKRLEVLFRSLCWTFPILLITEFILPTATGWFGLTNIGILSMLIIVFGLYYSVVKHRLFDLRLIIIRSLGYLFSLVFLASIYGFLTFGVVQYVFDLHFAIIVQIFLSSATAVAALSFSRLKRNFDKLTNRIFYQDAYDSEDLFDNLNRILVSTLDLDVLSSKITNLFANEFKAQFCVMDLKRVKGRSRRVIATNAQDIPLEHIVLMRKLGAHFHKRIIVSDELGIAQHNELKSLYMKHNISMVVRLTSNIAKNDDGLGYLLLGPKKSGNPYTSQDYRVLDTIANELIIAIQNALHFEEIQNFNVTLQEKVTLATRELRRTNDKLKALDETKDDFISMASHQLRTPLTSVKGYLSMVLEGDAGKLTSTERKMLTQAFVSSQRMVYLISDLLNVSRLKTGKFVIDWGQVDLAEVIADEIAQLREASVTRQVHLQYDKPKDFPTLPLDDTKTRQVIMNFIDNAIYYTPAGGHITVELINKPLTIELKVTDDGIGVPKAEQHHLFTKFYRAANARQARPDGTGLGLFMAKKVVIAQGGSIIFDSKEGQGSTFGFTFSKAKLNQLSIESARALQAKKS